VVLGAVRLSETWGELSGENKKRKQVASRVRSLGEDYLPYSSCNCRSVVWTNTGEKDVGFDSTESSAVPPSTILSDIITLPAVHQFFLPFLVTSWV
jgi:hypothetical protein